MPRLNKVEARDRKLGRDNHRVITLTKNNKYHTRTKDRDIQYHFSCQDVDYRTMELCYCPTYKSGVNIFMKPVPHPILEKDVPVLGLETNQGWTIGRVSFNS